MTGQTPTSQEPSQPQPEEPQPDPNSCAGCGSKIIEHGHLTPLCAACRDKYAKFPIPMFVKALLVIFIGLSAAAFIKFPESLSAGVAFERGKKAESAKDYKTAAEEYAKARKQFKDSKLITVRLGVSMYKDGLYNEAMDVLDPLSGKEMSKELVTEVQAVFDDFDAKLAAQKAAMEKEAKKPANKKKVKK